MPGTNALAIKDALDVCAKQSDATDKLWVAFATVTLGVLGFAISGDKCGRTLVEALIIGLGYSCFCGGNYLALRKSQSQLIEIARITRSVAQESDLSLTKLEPFTVGAISVFYGVVWIVVCVAIFSITLSRQT